VHSDERDGEDIYGEDSEGSDGEVYFGDDSDDGDKIEE
jgi:hypothetical protein